jgi:hypothetical protein
MKGITVRSIGIARACFNTGLMNLACNLSRYAYLRRTGICTQEAACSESREGADRGCKCERTTPVLMRFLIKSILYDDHIKKERGKYFKNMVSRGSLKENNNWYSFPI